MRFEAFNMFVIGGHPSIENGLKMTCFNPMIVSTGEEEVMMKEGCLTYPFIFLDIKRPRKIMPNIQMKMAIYKSTTRWNDESYIPT